MSTSLPVYLTKLGILEGLFAILLSYYNWSICGVY